MKTRSCSSYLLSIATIPPAISLCTVVDRSHGDETRLLELTQVQEGARGPDKPFFISLRHPIWWQEGQGRYGRGRDGRGQDDDGPCVRLVTTRASHPRRLFG